MSHNNSKGEMSRHTLYLFTIAVALVAFTLSSCRKKAPQKQEPQEDMKAKQMLQGVWMNEDDEDVAFKAQGDTIYYPDSTSAPVHFSIAGGKLILNGANETAYPIVRQTAHVFQFKNASGDVVHLVKSEDKDDASLFSDKQPLPLNQNRLIKRDTVIVYGNDRYHSYVQINPTTYKVIKASYNDEGVEVDNVYHDNIIHISIFQGARKLFSRDFRKGDFSKYVPQEILAQSILSDMTLTGMDPKGTHFQAQLVIPDSQSSFLVELVVDFHGRATMAVKK